MWSLLFRVHLVESIPVGLYPSSPSSRKSIADSWLHLLDRANSSVHIAAFYFTLRDSDLGSHESSDSQVSTTTCTLRSHNAAHQVVVPEALSLWANGLAWFSGKKGLWAADETWIQRCKAPDRCQRPPTVKSRHSRSGWDR